MTPGRSVHFRLTLLLLIGFGAACKDTTGPTPPADLRLDLAAGDVHVQAGPIGSIELSQPGEYLLVPLLASTAAESRLNVGLRVGGISGPSVAATPSSPHPASAAALPSVADVLHVRLQHRFRRELAPYLDDLGRQRRGDVDWQALRSARAAAEGDTLSLSVSTSCTVEDDRTGVVAVESTRALILKDVAAPADGYTMEDLRGLGEAFDQDIQPLAEENFGAPTDLDGNERIIIFFTPAVNEMSDSLAGPGSLISGYVWQGDFLPNCEESNFGEVFYMAVPDGRGDRTRDNMLRYVRSTLVHELQHLINAGRTIHRHDGNAFEEVWMEEALSHTAEELLFYRISGLAPGSNLDVDALRAAELGVAAFNAYQLQNFARLGSFLTAPDADPLIDSGAPLGSRGALWQFFRYMADRRGGGEDQLWFDLVNTRQTGFDNLSRFVGSEPYDWIHDWAISVYTDDLVSAVAPEYRQPSWNHRALYSETRGSYPLDLRSLTGDTSILLRSGAPAYFRFRVGSEEPGRITVRNPDERVRMGVVRIQ